MSEIQILIRRACPNFEIDAIENLGEGDFCRAFLVNQTSVFRFSKHEAARRSLRREYCLLPKIAGMVSLKIPQPEIASFEGTPENSFIAYEFLPDAPLTREVYLRLDERARTRCAERVARFLNELHSVDVEVAGKCGVSVVDYMEKYAALLTKVREKFRGRLESEDFEFAENELIKFLESSETANFQKVLLHGDLSPEHVLFDGKTVTSIIDFGDMMIGEAAWDFLWIYEDYGADFFGRALEAYEHHDKTALKRRIYTHSGLAAIEWLVSCHSENDDSFAEALAQIRALRRSAN